MGEAGLGDPFAVSVPDPHPEGDRWISICAVGRKIVVVVHTWPDDVNGEEAAGRVISVRPATSHERRRYEDDG